MKLKHYDLHIPKEEDSDPFENCKLERKQYAAVLTDIVSGYADGFVMAINNKWGTGKTTFVKMWRQQLVNNEFKTLYFNAWENDFENDVLVALISELEELKDSKSKEAFEEVIKRAAPLTKKLLPSFVKSLASKHVGDEFVKELVTGIAEVGAKELGEELKNFAKKKKGLEDFKKSLEKFVEKVDDEKPVVFIIDELDRCRPNYAVEVLECIKHLFDVPGIVYVLSIDKIQLGNAVRGVYGSEYIDAEEYLRRFIDLEYSIPEANVEKYIDYLYDYFDFDDFIESHKRKSVERLYANTAFKLDKGNLKFFTETFYSKGQFTLRQIEKIFARVRVTLRAFQQDQYIFSEIVIFISYLDLKHPDVLKSIRGYNYSIQELTNKLDDILMPFVNNNTEKGIVTALASFLCKYFEGYPKEVKYKTNEKLAERVDGGEYKLFIESKFENRGLSKFIEYEYRNRDTSHAKLDIIIRKYDLTESLSN